MDRAQKCATNKEILAQSKRLVLAEANVWYWQKQTFGIDRTKGLPTPQHNHYETLWGRDIGRGQMTPVEMGVGLVLTRLTYIRQMVRLSGRHKSVTGYLGSNRSG
jgi:hypothetical protein